jgi:hypothetical protein
MKLFTLSIIADFNGSRNNFARSYALALTSQKKQDVGKIKNKSMRTVEATVAYHREGCMGHMLMWPPAVILLFYELNNIFLHFIILVE